MQQRRVEPSAVLIAYEVWFFVCGVGVVGGMSSFQVDGTGSRPVLRSKDLL